MDEAWEGGGPRHAPVQVLAGPDLEAAVTADEVGVTVTVYTQ